MAPTGAVVSTASTDNYAAGESIPEVVDTGAKFYNYPNIDDLDIAHLVYG
jgi:hypothetical protein